MEDINTIHLEHTGWLTFPGEDLVAEYVSQGWFEYLESAFLWAYLREGDHFLDIGSHVGLHSATARKVVGARGRIICLEPNPDLHDFIEQNVVEPELLPYAIGEVDGVTRFTVDTPAKSSFGHISLQAEAGFDVQVRRLASVVSEVEGLRPDLIKVDIEGSELSLFSGSKEYLQDYDGVIVVEFSKLNLERFGHSTEELESRIRDLGFEICAYDGTSNTLLPTVPAHPVWYDNYYLTRDPDQANRKLGKVARYNQAVVSDIVRKGTAASAIYQASEQLAKERGLVLNVCENLRGLHAHISSNGQQPLQPVSATAELTGSIAELQKAYGVTKSISLHNLAEIQLREKAMVTLGKLTAKLASVSQQYAQQHSLTRPDEKSSGTVGIEPGDLLTERLQREVQQLQMLFDEVDIRLAAQDAAIAQRDVQLEQEMQTNNDLSGQLEKLQDVARQLEKDVLSASREMQRRTAEFNDTISRVIIDLMELKKSRVLRIAGTLNTRVMQKLDTTIESLSS